jgi:hypothetical protein
MQPNENMIRDTMTWLGGKDAAIYLGVSRDKVEIYALRWPRDGQHVPRRLRWKHLQLKPGSPPIRRYYRPDLDAFRNFKRQVRGPYASDCHPVDVAMS